MLEQITLKNLERKPLERWLFKKTLGRSPKGRGRKLKTRVPALLGWQLQTGQAGFRFEQTGVNNSSNVQTDDFSKAKDFVWVGSRGLMSLLEARPEGSEGFNELESKLVVATRMEPAVRRDAGLMVVKRVLWTNNWSFDDWTTAASVALRYVLPRFRRSKRNRLKQFASLVSDG